VFCASLADVFDNAVDPQWRADLFGLIAQPPNLDWLLLTKRIGNVPAMVSIIPGHLPANVWLGATIVNQAEADRDIPKLLAVPARVRFLSMEPLLGPVDLAHIEVWGGDAEIYPLKSTADCVDDEGEPAADIPPLDWVIVGGESGPGARSMRPAWARSLRDQCEAAGVPFLFKQWGDWLPAKEGRSITGRMLVLEGSAPFTDHLARLARRRQGLPAPPRHMPTVPRGRAQPAWPGTLPQGRGAVGHLSTGGRSAALHLVAQAPGRKETMTSFQKAGR
jgi:protein gp37